MPRIVNSTTFGMKYCTGVSTAAGQDQQSDQPQRAWPDRAGRAVVVATPTNGQHDEHAEAADRPEHPALEGLGAVLLLHEQVGEHRRGEQPEPDRRERHDHAS